MPMRPVDAGEAAPGRADLAVEVRDGRESRELPRLSRDHPQVLDPAALRGADDEVPVLEDLEPFVIAGNRLPERTPVGRPRRVDEVAEDHPLEAPGQGDVTLLDEPPGGLVGRVADARIHVVGARRLEAADEGLEVPGVVEVVVVENGEERGAGRANTRVQRRASTWAAVKRRWKAFSTRSAGTRRDNQRSNRMMMGIGQE